ncbi:MAG: DNA methyltransferase [Candidatus Thorarchaeota archaeon]|jgi:DNA modification methylase
MDSPSSRAPPRNITTGHDGVLEIEGDIDPDFSVPDGAKILIISQDQTFLTHGIHKFPAKFFPELPRYLIKRYSEPSQIVLDPMCGSGTVILEAMLSNRTGVGVDIDPIARLITKAKTTPLNHDSLDSAARDLSKLIQERNMSGEFTPSIPEFNYRDAWFKDFVLRELAIVRDSICDVMISESDYDSSQGIRDFMRVVFSSIIRDVSNADPHCTRTVIRKNLEKKISPGEVLDRFSNVLSKQVRAMRDLSDVYLSMSIGDVQIPEGTATQTGLEDESVDLAVTSPPYINAVDYPRTHQLEMYWLGLVEDGPLSNMKRKYIGTETVYKDEYSQLRESGFESLDPLLRRIFTKDPRRSFIVFKFFEDMKEQLKEIYRVLHPGGHYCLAIGNNVIRGNVVESHKILTEIATTDDVGFRIEKTFFSGVIRHFIKIPRKERMAGEWILVLRKP